MPIYTSPIEIIKEAQEELLRDIESDRRYDIANLSVVPESVDQFRKFEPIERLGITFVLLEKFVPNGVYNKMGVGDSTFPKKPFTCDISDLVEDAGKSDGVESVQMQAMYCYENTRAFDQYTDHSISLRPVAKIGKHKYITPKTTDIYADYTYRKPPDIPSFLQCVGSRYYVKSDWARDYDSTTAGYYITEDVDFEAQGFRDLLPIIDRIGEQVITDKVIPLRQKMGEVACTQSVIFINQTDTGDSFKHTNDR